MLELLFVIKHVEAMLGSDSNRVQVLVHGECNGAVFGDVFARTLNLRQLELLDYIFGLKVDLSQA